MTLDEIFEYWTQDSKIDRVELGNAALDIPKLHNKYYRMLSAERIHMKKMEANFAILTQNKRAWILGELTSDELKNLGWQPHLKKLLKSEIDEYLKSDRHVIDYTIKMAEQREKIDTLDSIIKMIINRSFQISNAISWEKFKVGM